MHFNGLKTAALLGLMSAIIVGIGATFQNQTILIGSVLLAIGTNAYVYFNSAKLALRSMLRPNTSSALFHLDLSVPEMERFDWAGKS